MVALFEIESLEQWQTGKRGSDVIDACGLGFGVIKPRG